jgi:hypothetical protein
VTSRFSAVHRIDDSIQLGLNQTPPVSAQRNNGYFAACEVLLIREAFING